MITTEQWTCENHMEICKIRKTAHMPGFCDKETLQQARLDNIYHEHIMHPREMHRLILSENSEWKKLFIHTAG